MTINPRQPCVHPRGSAQRLAMYAARDKAGLPLFNPLDSEDTIPIQHAVGSHQPVRQYRAKHMPFRVEDSL